MRPLDEPRTPAKNFRIYLAASISGGREDLNVYSEIYKLLSEYGVVAPEQTSDREIGMFGDRDDSALETHRREDLRVRSADVMVAETTVSSLGVGYQIALAALLGKPVLCLHRIGGRPLSRLIAGNPDLDVRRYSSVTELAAIVDEFLAPLADQALELEAAGAAPSEAPEDLES